MTPSGMKSPPSRATIGGGISTPGFVGHGKYNICQRKFIRADGGLLPHVWMPKMLKEKSAIGLKARSYRTGRAESGGHDCR